MEANAISQVLQAPRADQSGSQRTEALAAKRRQATENQIARAEDSRARASDQLAELREAVARVIGANTRLSITRPDDSASFVYRAIDIDTGEIVSEWPQQTFVELVRGVREDVRVDVDHGLMLDQVA